MAVAQGCRSLEKAQLLELTCAESCLSSVGRRRRLAVSASTLRDCSLSSSSRSFLFLSSFTLLYSTLPLSHVPCCPPTAPSSFDQNASIPSRIPFSVFTTTHIPLTRLRHFTPLHITITTILTRDQQYYAPTTRLSNRHNRRIAGSPEPHSVHSERAG